MKRTRRESVLVVLVACVLIALCRPALCGKGRPNVIVVLVDDLGYNDLSIQGSKDVKSPKIDRLMQDGVRFKSAYSVAGFCSPARTGVFSGIHPYHLGHWYNPAGDYEDTAAGMPVGVTTLPETLKKRGYSTLAIGKWHLGFSEDQWPMNRGFDHFYGFLGGQFNYTKTTFLNNLGELEYIYDDYKRVKKVRYLTHEWTDKAVEFATKNRKNPFFIYLGYNTPHRPFEFLKRDLDKSVSEERQPHVAMIKALDRDIGRLRKHLDRLGLTRKTLIFFANDNGGHEFGTNNAPLRGFKNSLYEGGVRVPFSITWPGKIKKGQRADKLVSLFDIYPTVQAAANVPSQHRNRKLQGIDLLPHVRLVGNKAPQKSGVTHKYLCNRKHTAFGTIVQGHWKLWLDKKVRSSHLYNLKKDIGEKRNVLQKNAARAKRMRRLFLQWDKKTTGPNFDRSLGGRVVAPNPLSVKITGKPGSVRVGDKVTLVAKGKHDKGKPIEYSWEVFRPNQRTLALFSTIKKTPGVTVTSRLRRRTRVAFKKTGKWIIRINIREKRFVKWADAVVNVRR